MQRGLGCPAAARSGGRLAYQAWCPLLARRPRWGSQTTLAISVAGPALTPQVSLSPELCAAGSSAPSSDGSGHSEAQHIAGSTPRRGAGSLAGAMPPTHGTPCHAAVEGNLRRLEQQSDASGDEPSTSCPALPRSVRRHGSGRAPAGRRAPSASSSRHDASSFGGSSSSSRSSRSEGNSSVDQAGHQGTPLRADACASSSCSSGGYGGRSDSGSTSSSSASRSNRNGRTRRSNSLGGNSGSSSGGRGGGSGGSADGDAGLRARAAARPLWKPARDGGASGSGALAPGASIAVPGASGAGLPTAGAAAACTAAAGATCAAGAACAAGLAAARALTALNAGASTAGASAAGASVAGASSAGTSTSTGGAGSAGASRALASSKRASQTAAIRSAQSLQELRERCPELQSLEPSLLQQRLTALAALLSHDEASALSLCAAVPALLLSEPSGLAAALHAVAEALGGDVADAVTAARSQPLLLVLPPGRLQETLTTLCATLRVSRARASALLRALPQLPTLCPATLAAKLSGLQRLLGPAASAADLAAALDSAPRLLTFSTAALESHHAALVSTLGPPVVAAALRREPGLLALRPASLLPKLRLLVQLLGCQQQPAAVALLVCRHPAVLRRSLTALSRCIRALSIWALHPRAKLRMCLARRGMLTLPWREIHGRCRWLRRLMLSNAYYHAALRRLPPAVLARLLAALPAGWSRLQHLAECGQEGAMGLLEAAECGRPEFESRFPQYGAWLEWKTRQMGADNPWRGADRMRGIGAPKDNEKDASKRAQRALAAQRRQQQLAAADRRSVQTGPTVQVVLTEAGEVRSGGSTVARPRRIVQQALDDAAAAAASPMQLPSLPIAAATAAVALRPPSRVVAAAEGASPAALQRPPPLRQGHVPSVVPPRRWSPATPTARPSAGQAMEPPCAGALSPGPAAGGSGRPPPLSHSSAGPASLAVPEVEAVAPSRSLAPGLGSWPAGSLQTAQAAGTARPAHSASPALAAAGSGRLPSQSHSSVGAAPFATPEEEALAHSLAAELGIQPVGLHQSALAAGTALTEAPAPVGPGPGPGRQPAAVG